MLKVYIGFECVWGGRGGLVSYTRVCNHSSGGYSDPASGRWLHECGCRHPVTCCQETSSGPASWYRGV